MVSGVPVEAKALEGAVQVACGDVRTCALLESGKVFCWGIQAYSREQPAYVPTPIAVDCEVGQIAAGWTDFCALCKNGKVACWGMHAKQNDGNPWRPEPVAIEQSVVEIAGNYLRTEAGGIVVHRFPLGPQQFELPCPAARLWANAYACVLAGPGTFCSTAEHGLQPLGGVNGDEVAQIIPTWNGNARILWRSGMIATYRAEGETLEPKTGLPPVEEIAIGSGHECVLTRAGAVYCWGKNDVGQLGTGRRGNATTPQLVVSRLDELKPKAPPQPVTPLSAPPVEVRPEITMGASHLCGLANNGTVQCLGSYDHGEMGSGDPVPGPWSPSIHDMWGLRDAVEVSAGGMTTCVRRVTGAVACTGSLVIATGEDPGSSRILRPIPGVDDAIGLAVGASVACALRRTGRVVCWGNNRHGQLGTGERAGPETSDNWDLVAEVKGLDDANQIAAGDDFACALRRTGAVFCWGRAHQDQMGDCQVNEDRPTPQPVPNIHDATRIAASGGGACAVQKGGRVWCWGTVMGYPRPMRDDDTPPPPATFGLPRRAPGIERVVDLGVGSGDVGCAVSSKGAAWCFGGGATIAAPMRVWRVTLSEPSTSTFPTSEADVTFTQIRCGGGSCCALSRAGSVWCQGMIGHLVPGVAPNTESKAFVRVPGMNLGALDAPSLSLGP